MIYTVTLNPSIDHYMTADGVIPYSVNRALSSRTVCGGKGINVSLALNALGVENTALGFCADMKLVTLEKIRDALRDGKPEVTLPTELMDRARAAIQRMLAIR